MYSILSCSSVWTTFASNSCCDMHQAAPDISCSARHRPGSETAFAAHAEKAVSKTPSARRPSQASPRMTYGATSGYTGHGLGALWCSWRHVLRKGFGMNTTSSAHECGPSNLRFFRAYRMPIKRIYYINFDPRAANSTYPLRCFIREVLL